MRSHRRIPFSWPALLAVSVTVGVVVAPVTASAEGDAAPPGGDVVVEPDAALTEPATPIESAPETTPATEPVTDPAVTEPPTPQLPAVGGDILPLPDTQPPADSGNSSTTMPDTDPAPTSTTQPPDSAPTSTTVANVDPEAESEVESESPPNTQPPADSAAPTTTLPNGDPEPTPTAPLPADSAAPSTTLPNAQTAAPSTTLPAAGPEVAARWLDAPAIAPAPDVESTLDEVDEAFAALPDGIVRAISFPVLGPVRFFNDWGACRDECTRRHVGTDVIGVRMQPLLAAVDGTVTRIRYINVGRDGVDITITGADGWYYNYFHVNNDSPGTDDGSAGHEWRISPLLTVGSPVRAGQVIAYMGDSGNAEVSVPHLHFEIRQPDRTPINPYPSLAAAQARQTCSGNDPGLALSADARTLSSTVVAVIPIDGGGRWLIDASGRVYAEGSAARVQRIAGMSCSN